jgi:hypothetical protein
VRIASASATAGCASSQIDERALGLAREELVACALDQRSGLAMHAGDDVGADRRRLLEARK